MCAVAHTVRATRLVWSTFQSWWMSGMLLTKIRAWGSCCFRTAIAWLNWPLKLSVEVIVDGEEVHRSLAPSRTVT